MAAGTLAFFGGLGILLIPLSRNISLGSFLSGSSELWIQLSVGAVFGFISAKAGWQIVELPFLSGTKSFFTELIKPIKLNTVQIIFISICAGIGEELFFRGVLQPWLGVWFTAIAFVMLHGYLNPFNLPLTVYGFYMVIVIAVMGLMTEHLGILTAMIAHIFIDIILLRALSKAPLPGKGNKLENHKPD